MTYRIVTALDLVDDAALIAAYRERYAPGAEGIVVKLRRAHAIGPLAQLDLERDDNAELIEAVMSNERFSHLQLKEGETLVVRPKRLHVFVDAGASI